jgi:hypothetical protein
VPRRSALLLAASRWLLAPGQKLTLPPEAPSPRRPASAERFPRTGLLGLLGRHLENWPCGLFSSVRCHWHSGCHPSPGAWPRATSS